jgi:hypothetical protein
MKGAAQAKIQPGRHDIRGCSDYFASNTVRKLIRRYALLGPCIFEILARFYGGG